LESALAVAGLTALALTATGFDNLLLLVGIASRRGQPFAPILGGVLVATAVLAAACLGAAFGADLLPQRRLGLLGLVPLGLGLRELALLYRSAGEDAEALGAAEAGTAAIGAAGVAGVMLANSVDSLGTLVPLFAETRDGLLPAAVLAIPATTLSGCALARWIVSHPRLGPPIRRVGPRIVPFVLIAVGIYVLSNTGTDTALP